MLVRRRTSDRSWNGEGRTRARRMSLGSSLVTPARGLVATRDAIVLGYACPPVRKRGVILTSFTDKGDNFAQTYLATGTYGFIPGHPSADTQPLYGWFLIPLYWIFGRHWEVVGLAQIVVACGTTLVVWQIGKRWLSPAIGIV